MTSTTNIEIIQMATTYSKGIENDIVSAPPTSNAEQSSPESTSSSAPTLAPENAWKIIGSPARRASITASSLETPSPPQLQNGPINEMMQKRSRTSSITGVIAPPGLADSMWAPRSNSDTPMSDDEEKRNRFLGKGSTEHAISTMEEINTIPTKSRRNSSIAIFGLTNEEEDEINDTLPEMDSMWSPGAGKSPYSTLPGRRRSSTQSAMWEGLRAAQLATPDDMNGNNSAELLEKYKREQQSHNNLRRFSVASSVVNRFMNRNVQDANLDEENPSVLQLHSAEHHFETRRRHSLAGPVADRKLNTKFLSKGLEALGLDNAKIQLEKIDDYFENTESRTKAFEEAGKNLQANQDFALPTLQSPEVPQSVHTWPIYVVEFKAGRTDYFYLPSELSHLKIDVGDLAIVEADRGKDLGKVIENNITSMNELRLYQANHEDPLVDSHNAIGKEIQPKKLFRLAEPSEVAMLLQKGQDESKANHFCQLKIRQKKLPMEIVDAEYQWDRRKLTFYFVADHRIDFRELVRELFKIYKTRIWMCAVQPRTLI